MSSFGFQTSKIRMFFGIITADQVFKSFLGRNNSLKPFFGFCDRLPFCLKESSQLVKY